MWKNLLLTLATILIFFLGIELALRITGIDSGRPKTPPIYQKSDDPALSYELRPNLNEKAFRTTIKTDRRGFRSEEIHPGKDSIVILGDSIAFGYGLENEETLGARLFELIERNDNVITAAAPGYTLGQQAALYKKKVAMLHPSSLILVFYWNDLNDTEPAVLDDDGNLQAPGWTPQESRCHPIEEGILSFIPGRCWLDLHSAFYRTVKKVVSSRVEKSNLEKQEVEYRKNPFNENVTSDQLKLYEDSLTAFADALPKDLPRLFIIWPEKQLHLTITPRLKEIAEQNGFKVLNLYEVFGNKPESLDWDTVHPSAKTVEEAAAVIKAAMEEWEMMN